MRVADDFYWECEACGYRDWRFGGTWLYGAPCPQCGYEKPRTVSAPGSLRDLPLWYWPLLVVFITACLAGCWGALWAVNQLPDGVSGDSVSPYQDGSLEDESPPYDIDDYPGPY